MSDIRDRLLLLAAHGGAGGWARHLEEAALEIERLRDEVRQWIPVTDMMPEEGVEVLTWNPTGPYQTVASWWPKGHGEWRSGDPRADDYGQFEPEGITHWMPLPSPPAETPPS